MTGEEMERAIQFLIDHHAKLTSKMERQSSDIEKLKEAQERTTENLERIARLADTLSTDMYQGFREMHEGFAEVRAGLRRHATGSISSFLQTKSPENSPIRPLAWL